MSTNTNETVEHTVSSSSPTGIARCAPLDGQSAPYTVHGVAIGSDEVTYGANGPKYWPAAELRESVQSLVGVPFTKNHDDETVESVVGEITDAGFEPDVGIVYEAEVDDGDLATKIARGRLEVSVHAVHTDGGRTDEGELIVEDITFLDLSLVPRGGSPSNSVQSGESPSEVLASLDTDSVVDFFEDPDSSDSESMSDDTDEPNNEATCESESTEADSEETIEESEHQPDEAELESDEVDEEFVEAELEVAELQEELESLRAENQELRNEIETVRLEYAEHLSDGTPFEASLLAERLSVEELRDHFDSAEASLTADKTGGEANATPAPQTGGGDGELSTGGDDASDEIAELESKIGKYEEMGWTAAKSEAEQRLDELQA